MIMEYNLQTDSFCLNLDLMVYETDALMQVRVSSDGFAGETQMDINVKEMDAFSKKLWNIYESLNGSAKIQEWYGYQQFLEFEGDGKGHITIRGMICSHSGSGFFQKLKFENRIDQTQLRSFAKELNDSY